MRDSSLIYLDHAATTPVRPEAVDAACEVLRSGFGNPSSRYPLGRQAARRLEQDRAAVAKALGCAPGELIFTSGGTEGNNWAVRCAAERGRHQGKHLISTAMEHDAVLQPLKALERQGYEITWLQPDREGTISLDALRAALRPDTVLVSMMLVNNELGTILPVAEAARLVHASGAPALVHCDAVQAFLKLPFTPKQLGVDLLTVSGHKVGAPKGIGALYVRKGLKGWKPLLLGGGQESGLRSGTEPTAQIAAFARAAELGAQEREAAAAHTAALRDRLLTALHERVPEVRPLVAGGAPHILALTLPGYKSEVLVRVLGDRGICVSAGSACHKGKPSHVYAALPIGKPLKDGAFRVSFGPENTEEDVDALVEALRDAVDTLFPALS